MLEQEKFKLNEAIDKLSKEEANHVATKNMLDQEKYELERLKEQFDLEKQKHSNEIALLEQERMNSKELMDKFENEQTNHLATKIGQNRVINFNSVKILAVGRT